VSHPGRKTGREDLAPCDSETRENSDETTLGAVSCETRRLRNCCFRFPGGSTSSPNDFGESSRFPAEPITRLVDENHTRHEKVQDFSDAWMIRGAPVQIVARHEFVDRLWTRSRITGRDAGKLYGVPIF
jgi:hypothetical protein